MLMTRKPAFFRSLVRRSAVFLVSQNTMAVLSPRSLSIFWSRNIFSDSFTMMTFWVTRSVALPGVPIVTTTGFRRYFLARRSTAGFKLLEGIASMTAATCGSKPMSIILSASSSTT
ncbi:hypothetical protein BDA96_07G181700 [Sorghum bicolor]|uniref:Uncharacterized protein n=1 Tax=Sorghum bicolor TaxID=4558 RepID=A0A921UAY3_SORBI|nr:hypothetical protein BDA96_07G181700 [Sorghum bicolor]